MWTDGLLKEEGDSAGNDVLKSAVKMRLPLKKSVSKGQSPHVAYRLVPKAIESVLLQYRKKKN